MNDKPFLEFYLALTGSVSTEHRDEFIMADLEYERLIPAISRRMKADIEMKRSQEALKKHVAAIFNTLFKSFLRFSQQDIIRS